MIPIATLHRQSRAKVGRLDALDAARDHLEACTTLDEIVREWFQELDTEDQDAVIVQTMREWQIHPLRHAMDPRWFALHVRRFAFLASKECETLVDDLAAGAKGWPR